MRSLVPMICNPLTDNNGCLGEVLSLPGDALGGAAGSVAGSAFDSFVQTLVDGANWVIKELMTLWMNAPDPEIEGASSLVTWVNEHVAYLVMVTMTGSLIVSGARLAIYGKAEDARSAAETLVRTALVSVLAGTLITTSLAIGDEWSTWIVDQADLNLDAVLLSTSGAIVPGVLWLLAIIVILTQIIQVAFMVVRNAMVIILAGTLTLAAASSSTESGRQWWKKSIAWLLAFILYKPAAALIYAVAFKMASSKGMFSQLSGIFLMVLAIFALPALMRLFVPMTASLGGANAGALAGATVGAGLALGAMAASGGLSGAVSGAGGFKGFGGGAAPVSSSGGGGGPAGAASQGLPAGGAPRGPSGSGAAGSASSSGLGSRLAAGGDVGGDSPSGAGSGQGGGASVSTGSALRVADVASRAQGASGRVQSASDDLAGE